MNTLETGPAQSAPPATFATNGPLNPEPPRKRRGLSLGGTLVLLILAGSAAGAVYAYFVGTARVQQDAGRLMTYVRYYVPAITEPAREAKPAEAKPATRWDGFVRVKYEDAKTLGLLLHTVERQAEPIKLPLMGRTDYDPNTLSKIRPRFDTLVEHVRRELGQHVQKGDPLVDLFSTELAAAKNDFQTAYVQWQHDLRLLTLREKLVKEKAISQQLFVDSQNDEQKSRLAFTTSKEKLLVFGVPEEQINGLLKNLGELGDQPLPQELHAISDKARMTRLSPVDGIVIKRDAVTGNLYDNTDVLMVIAELNHLFVLVNVYEADQAKVAMGQEMEVRFPYLDRTIPAKVEYVASEVSKDTRAIQIRASIPNVDGKLKADMLVRAILKIPPESRQTVIPRLAMVVMNGNEYAFVQKEPTDANDVLQFERRQLVVAEERDDHVVVKTGLKPGEHVASNGSLVLAQLYEDQQMVATGMPLK